MNHKTNDLTLGACFGLLVMLLSTLAVGQPQMQPTSASSIPAASGHVNKKNPKLSTQIADLARAVPQARGAVAPGQSAPAPEGFAVEKLPKPIQDAVHAHHMVLTKDAEVQVYIHMSAITDANLQSLRNLGVTIQIVGQPKPNTGKNEVLTKVPMVQGLLPVTMIDQVAALAFVHYIRLPDYGFHNTGSVDTQGDSILQAMQARSQFGVDGTGVRVGVISSGIAGVFASGCTTCGPTIATPSPIASGDLPSATGTRNSSGVLTSVSGGITAPRSFCTTDGFDLEATALGSEGAEGTAMLEIVHDLAPGAQLWFANFCTDMEFEQAASFLASKTDVVVDDVGFAEEPPFDGTSSVSANTATALNTDTNPIRGYFTAVGNQVFDHWGEPFTDSGQNLALSCPATQGGTSTTGHVQLFQATANTNDANNLGPSIGDPLLILSGTTVQVVLAWDDPITGSSNDYDLYLFLVQSGSLTAPLRCSVNPQTGSQPPIESLAYTNNSGATQEIAILVQNVNNAAAAKHFDMFLGGIGNGKDLNFYTPSGSVPAESDAGGSPVSVVSVGATDAQTDASNDPPATVMEPYSSQGPTEATPQAASRMKPDVTATDGVSVTGAGGFGFGDSLRTSPCAPSQTPCFFFGTSAAAPHAAGVAALLLQSAPCLLSSSNVNTPATARANLRNFITSTAVPLSGVSQPVPNNVEGAGVIDALAAAIKTLPTASAGSNQTVNGTSANGAAVTLSGSGSDPDSCAVTLAWSGSCGSATGANPSLTCPLGMDTETLTVSNGGATKSLPTSIVQVTVSDFTVTAPQPTASVPPGQPANYTISVGTQFGAFTNSVGLACSLLPRLTSCSFSPPNVTPNGGTVNSTLTISTTAPSSVAPMSQRRGPDLPLFSMYLGLLIAFSAVTVFTRRAGRRRGFEFALSALVVCLLLGIVSCGGAGNNAATNSGTPAGSYNVVVTGSSNQLQHSVNITLTVQ